MPKANLSISKLPYFGHSISAPHSSSASSHTDQESIRTPAQHALREKILSPQLLSPPISEKDFDIAPFKPNSSDTTSLSQISHKRGRRKRRTSKSAHASTTSLRNQKLEASNVLQHAHSVPNIRPNKRAKASTITSTQRYQMPATDTTFRSSAAHRRNSSSSRRWTLPTKTRPSRVVSGKLALKPHFIKASTATTVVQPMSIELPTKNGIISVADIPQLAVPSTSGPESQSWSATVTTLETPAMITLRRATMSQGTAVDSEEPTAFGLDESRRSSFPSHTAATFGRLLGRGSLQALDQEQRSKENSPGNSSSSRTSKSSAGSRSPSCRLSVTSNNVQPPSSTTAPLALSNVSITLPIQDNEPETGYRGSRKLSTTKIFAGSTLQEIVWEDYTSSSSEPATEAQSSHSRSSAEPFPNPWQETSGQQSNLFSTLTAHLSQEEHSTCVNAPPTEAAGSKSRIPSFLSKPFKSRRKSVQALFKSVTPLPEPQPLLSGVPEESVTALDEADNQEVLPNPLEETPQSFGALNIIPPRESNHVFFFPPLSPRRTSAAWREPLASTDSPMTASSKSRENNSMSPQMGSAYPSIYSSPLASPAREVEDLFADMPSSGPLLEPPRESLKNSQSDAEGEKAKGNTSHVEQQPLSMASSSSGEAPPSSSSTTSKVKRKSLVGRKLGSSQRMKRPSIMNPNKTSSSTATTSGVTTQYQSAQSLKAIEDHGSSSHMGAFDGDDDESLGGGATRRGSAEFSTALAVPLPGGSAGRRMGHLWEVVNGKIENPPSLGMGMGTAKRSSVLEVVKRLEKLNEAARVDVGKSKEVVGNEERHYDATDAATVDMGSCDGGGGDRVARRTGYNSSYIAHLAQRSWRDSRSERKGKLSDLWEETQSQCGSEGAVAACG
ncbi:MAG: hypothetical protein Q9227_007417 [Pyrenula ochraceoflavens]